MGEQLGGGHASGKEILAEGAVTELGVGAL